LVTAVEVPRGRTAPRHSLTHGQEFQSQWGRKIRGGQILLIFQDDVKGVNDTGEVSENGQQNVDEQISAATTLKEDSERREDDGQDDLADVASGESHCDGWTGD